VFSDESEKLTAKSRKLEIKEKRQINLKLTTILNKLPAAKKSLFSAQKLINWDEIKIEGYSTEQLKEQLNEIIKVTGSVRSLRDMLLDFKKNHRKLEKWTHAERPFRPKYVGQIYFKENREQIEQEYEREVGSIKGTKFVS
jgi:hypothetical protein